jgi:hypothetical protein
MAAKRENWRCMMVRGSGRFGDYVETSRGELEMLG